MLKSGVEKVVEQSLARSGPREAFTVAVLAAVPALASSSAAAAVVTTAKISGAAKGIGIFGILIGPLIGTIGGIIGTVQSIRNTRSPRERAFIKRFGMLIWIVVIAFMAVMFATFPLRHVLSGAAFMVFQAAMWAIYFIILGALIVWGNRGQRRIQREDGTDNTDAARHLVRPWKSRRAVYGSIGGGVAGGFAWMIAMSAQAGDYGSTVTVVLSGVIIVAVATQALLRRGAKVVRAVFVFVWAGVFGLTLVVANLRFHLWIAMLSDQAVEDVRGRIPLWGPNLILGIAGVGAGLLIWYATNPKYLAQQFPDRDGDDGGSGRHAEAPDCAPLGS